jgi:hypothetical protein
MTRDSGPLYEVTFFVDPDIESDVEQRIDEHVRRISADPAVVDCVLFDKAGDGGDRLVKQCLHTLAADDAIDEFVDGPASEFEDRLRAEFGDKLQIQARLLREDAYRERGPDAQPRCLNCGTRLSGQYCGTCGQRARSRLISLWELISDAFGDLLELDSRLWQTLVPLLIRPGKLTFDYLQGRRARYMPPFRMYLVLSLLFFLVAFFNPREKFSLFFEPVPEPTASEQEAEVADAATQREEVLETLREQGINVDDLSEDFDIENDGLNININGGNVQTDSDCQVDESDLEDMPAWLARRLTVERLKRACERTQIDGGKDFYNNLLDNIPAALIVLLPLMAFVLKALYPLSKRYYVEHLLFFVHFHAFFFLMLTLQILLLRLSAWVGIPEAIPVLTVIASSIYIAIYLFLAMRRVYGQGRVITFIKYVVLLVAYMFGFTATMLGALAIAAFSI